MWAIALSGFAFGFSIVALSSPDHKNHPLLLAIATFCLLGSLFLS